MATATTPGSFFTMPNASFHDCIFMSSPNVRTRISGLPTRIFSRRSFCSPFMTAMMRISALTPTATPPIAITLISDNSRDPRRLRR